MDERAIIDRHLPGLEEGWRPTVERLIEVILGELPDAQHERKWGQLTFTREGDWHHWIAAISPTKTAVKLVLHKGALLADPHGAMQGSGRTSRAEPLSLERAATCRHGSARLRDSVTDLRCDRE
jgi:hypothetical protein